ncbi:MAG: hypothetical protein ACRD3B_03970 [Candidatus Sulfotelmatobacter sp.]
MKMTVKKLIVGLFAAGLLAATAVAQCGSMSLKSPKLHSQAWRVTTDGAALQLVSSQNDPITGMWHVTFTAKGNTQGPPDGTPIDNALITWHADNTEIMNSGRPPQDGDFCMGVWKKTGKSTYTVNHFAWGGNDTSGGTTGIGNPTGPTRFVENVTLSADGNSFNGTFALKATDTSGNTTAEILGVLSGTRITTATSIQDLL